MKKLFCLSVALLFAAILVMANATITGNGTDKKKKENRKEQEKEKGTVLLHAPNRTTEFNFSQDFPNAKYVSWSQGQFDEASFLDNDVIKTAYYDDEYNLVGTTTDVDAAALPEKAREHINKMYPGYKIEKVVFFDDNEENDTNMFLFNHSFEDNDNYFPLLTNGSKQIILQVSMEGEVCFFENFR